MKASIAANNLPVWNPSYTSVIGFTWNTDFLLSSFYHAEVPSTELATITTNVKWCSVFNNKQTANDGSLEIKARFGFTGRTKCTWQLNTKDGNSAPAIQFKTADFTKYLVQWAEWINLTSIGNNQILPGTDSANFYLGAYASSDGIFLNPFKSGTGSDLTGDSNWNGLAYAPAFDVRDPNTKVAGSYGDAKYYTGEAGINIATNIVSVDTATIMKFIKYKQNENNSYNSLKSTYDTKKTTYNSAVTDEEARMKDFFKATFEPKIAIPTRPDPPTQPYSYMGPYLQLSAASATSASFAAQATQGSNAFIAAQTSNLPTNSYSNRLGYLVSSADTSATTPSVAQCGHVFGLLGQGDATLPANAQGFYYGAVASTETPGMMLSLFPTVDADAGLNANTKSITIDFKGVGW